jgi:hypothetical protein
MRFSVEAGILTKRPEAGADVWDLETDPKSVFEAEIQIILPNGDKVNISNDGEIWVNHKVIRTRKTWTD